jgi:hypothetical protein
MVIEILSKAGSILWSVLSGLWGSIVTIVPEAIAAAVIVFVGWVIGKLSARALEMILKRLGLDRWVKREGLSGAMWGKSLSSVFSHLLKWYIILVFAVEAVSLIPIEALAPFAGALGIYMHMLFASGMVLVVASLLAENLKKSITSSDIPYKEAAGSAVKAIALYFVAVIIIQVSGLKVDIFVDVFRIAFIAFAITIAIIVGIGFGLAFKDDAKAMLQQMKKKGRKR